MPFAKKDEGAGVGSPVEKLVEAFIELRDLRSQNKREFEAEDAPLKERMEKIEATLLAYTNKQGVSSVRVPAGTVSVVIKMRSSGEDWNATYEWIMENGRPDILARRFNDKVIEEIIEELGGPPPGIKIDRERSVQIRRAS